MMGKTAYSGPVYGAKANLISGYYQVVSSATSQVIASITLPTYESWVVTELIAHCSSCTTGVARISVLDDSTNLGTGTFVSTGASVVTTITPDAGEYEGAVVAAGSTLTVAANSGSTAVAMGSIQWSLRGYTRFVSSTRAE
jgi:hypothetical protein